MWWEISRYAVRMLWCANLRPMVSQSGSTSLWNQYWWKSGNSRQFSVHFTISVVQLCRKHSRFTTLVPNLIHFMRPLFPATECSLEKCSRKSIKRIFSKREFHKTSKQPLCQIRANIGSEHAQVFMKTFLYPFDSQYVMRILADNSEWSGADESRSLDFSNSWGSKVA